MGVHIGLKVAHVVGVIVWVGGALALIQLLLARDSLDPASRASLAGPLRRVSLGLVLPGLGLAVGAGVALVVTKLAYFQLAIWFHLKLPLVLLLAGDGLAMTWRALLCAADGAEPGPRRGGLIARGWVLAAGAVAAVTLALLKWPLRLPV